MRTGREDRLAAGGGRAEVEGSQGAGPRGAPEAGETSSSIPRWGWSDQSAEDPANDRVMDLGQSRVPLERDSQLPLVTAEGGWLLTLRHLHEAGWLHRLGLIHFLGWDLLCDGQTQKLRRPEAECATSLCTQSSVNLVSADAPQLPCLEQVPKQSTKLLLWESAGMSARLPISRQGRLGAAPRARTGHSPTPHFSQRAREMGHPLSFIFLASQASILRRTSSRGG
jgi:hypothetical protein